ncbi:N-acetylmuramoyl-L-alanine amidase [Candidatus Berkiella cookevillensis]|nr:N-acetylmuramoyl-L-alanine amidase [Candidatus Berkiella cookevillensis]MCS5707547.1 N-acetylmuramoyl-L-alanine amidase [Candidatus Berkiella cookevillensis]
MALVFLGMRLAMGATTIQGARVWAAPDNTRVVFDISDQVEYKLFTLSNPNRVVIDFKNADWKAKGAPQLNDSNIKSFRHGVRDTHDLRVVFDLHEAAKPKSFILAPNKTYGHRLVLDLESTTKKSVEKGIEKNTEQIISVPEVSSSLPTPIKRPQKQQNNKRYIVAIDPGHGGEDPGAVGRRFKTKEKDIVLQVARMLERKVNETPGLQAFLIRNGDYYVGLRQRINKARGQGADLFVSIHADSFKDSKATGASVFILSEKGASSEAARWLAESENRADLIGGISLDDKGDVLAQVLLDLSQSATKAASYELGQSVLNSLGRVTNLHKASVQQAGFAVLKSPDIPSILVEVGFLSNHIGEENLRKAAHQEKIASALLEGVKAYFAHRGQPLNKPVPKQMDGGQIAKVYKAHKVHEVKSGETLQKIALRYKTSTTAIVSHNRLKSHILQVGQQLKIPAESSAG